MCVCENMYEFYLFIFVAHFLEIVFFIIEKTQFETKS